MSSRKTGGNKCSVITCSNTYRSCIGQGITFHKFPRNPVNCKIWVVKCKGADNPHPHNVDNARVCSIHFTPESYVRDMRNELLGLAPKKLLKPDAIPSLSIPEFAQTTDNASAITAQYPNGMTARDENTAVTKRSKEILGKRKKDVEMMCEERKLLEAKVQHLLVANDTFVKKHVEIMRRNETLERNVGEILKANSILEANHREVLKKDKILEDKVHLLLVTIGGMEEREREMRHKTESLEENVQHVLKAKELMQKHYKQVVNRNIMLQKRDVHIVEREKQYKAKARTLKKEVTRHKRSVPAKVEEEIKKRFGKIFTEKQLCFMKSDKGVQWDDETITKALALRNVSRKAYLYLRGIGFPLPGISTLKRWT